MRDSAVMISSTMPSAKYSCSGSPLRFWNGSTAIDGLPAARSAGDAHGGSAAGRRLGAAPRLVELHRLRLRLHAELGMQPVFQALEQLHGLRGLAALEHASASARGSPLRAADRARAAGAPRVPAFRSAVPGASSPVSASSASRRSRCRSASSQSSKPASRMLMPSSRSPALQRAGLLQRLRRSGLAPSCSKLHRVDHNAGSDRAGRIAGRRPARPIASRPGICRSRVRACFRLSRACGIAAIAPQQARRACRAIGAARRQGQNRQQGAVLLARQLRRPRPSASLSSKTPRSLSCRDRHLARPDPPAARLAAPRYIELDLTNFSR